MSCHTLPLKGYPSTPDGRDSSSVLVQIKNRIPQIPAMTISPRSGLSLASCADQENRESISAVKCQPNLFSLPTLLSQLPHSHIYIISIILSQNKPTPPIPHCKMPDSKDKKSRFGLFGHKDRPTPTTDSTYGSEASSDTRNSYQSAPSMTGSDNTGTTVNDRTCIES